MLDAGDTKKKPQMAINDDLLILTAKCIFKLDVLETWGIMLTTMHGKASTQ